ncbi:MAG: hypothetical protein J6X11_00170, partial [Treponema sp.]|nr:hypothetical protein [Treponema sp.]
MFNSTPYVLKITSFLEELRGFFLAFEQKISKKNAVNEQTGKKLPFFKQPCYFILFIKRKTDHPHVGIRAYSHGRPPAI